MFMRGWVVFGALGGLTGFWGWVRGGVEEGRLVVAPAASLRRYHPFERRTLARDPVLRQSGRVFDPRFT